MAVERAGVVQARLLVTCAHLGALRAVAMF